MNKTSLNYKQSFVKMLISNIVFILLIAVSFVLRESETITQGVTFGIITFAIISYNIVKFTYWRCPECNAHLGRLFNPSHCPSCSAHFKGDCYEVDEGTSFVEVYEKIYKRQRLVGVVCLILMVPLLILIYAVPDKFPIISGKVGIISLASLIGVTIGYTLYNWRCPSCHKLLGKNMIVKSCTHCGVKLRE